MLIFILFMISVRLRRRRARALGAAGAGPDAVVRDVALGLGGSLVGGIIARVLIGGAGGFFFAFLGAVLLLYLYRRLRPAPRLHALRRGQRGSVPRANTRSAVSAQPPSRHVYVWMRRCVSSNS